jgi:hypothetical protein
VVEVVCPARTVSEAAPVLVKEKVPLISWVRAIEVLAALFESPPYPAVIEFVPTGKDEVARVAVAVLPLPLKVPVPIDVLPL